MGSDEFGHYAGPHDACTDDDIMALLHRNVIAVVGLSADPAKISHAVAAYMAQNGYDIIPVNPLHNEIMGRKSYPSVCDIPVPVDIVNVFRRPADIMPVVEASICAQATAVWLQKDIVNEEAYKKGLQAGLQMVMNRCIKVEHRRLMG